MVILCNGMIKSGSSLLKQYVLGLLRECFPTGGQEAFRKSVAGGHFRGAGDYLACVDARALTELCGIAEANGPVAIKVHQGVDSVVREGLASGRVRAVYTVRDPRDVILSAIDHRNRSRGSARPVCEGFTSVAASIHLARFWGEQALEWMNTYPACVFKYGALLADPVHELARAARLLSVDPDDRLIGKIVQREAMTRRPGAGQYNRGALARFRDEMSRDEQALCAARLGDIIVGLGFDL